MEPLLPDQTAELETLVFDLTQSAGGFAGRVNPILQVTVGNLVRTMNCYYSNLIEGHNTHPVAIERAMSGEYSAEPEKRDLQLEARAHIEVQRMIDGGQMPHPVYSVEALRWIHYEFCVRLPETLLTVQDPVTGRQEPVIPGEFRKHHVQVGRHIAPDPGSIGTLLDRFDAFYGKAQQSKIAKLVGVAASHHRLVWIHPFSDGNGRVSRLYSHAQLRALGVGSDMWSVSRGLARTVKQYKDMLAYADEPRQGDLDGRGNLTERGLRAFCEYFLTQCLDQVRFMHTLLDPEELLGRIEIWTNEEVERRRLPKGSWALLREAAVVGEFARTQAAALTGYQERQARSVLAALLDRQLLVSDTPKGKVRLGLPSDVVERWLPRLYPAN